MKTKHILLLLEWYDYRIHRGVAMIARKYGWQLNCPKDMVANEGFLKDWQGDGCIALLECRDTLDYFWKNNIPLVDLGLHSYKRPVPRVVTDNRQIGRLAAEHFRDHGYREVFTFDHGGKTMFRERFEGLREFMESEGGKVTMLGSSRTVKPDIIEKLSQVVEREGKRLKETSVGLFAYEDTMASEMISLCLQQELKVPENIAVLGVDNDDLINSGLTIGLSSIDSDQEGLGMAAGELLQSVFRGENCPKDILVHRHPPKGVVTRGSTDCYAVNNAVVAKALHWIHKNFYMGIQAIDVANAVGVSQQGLQKAFAKSYTRSPGEEIRQQRIQAVAHLLGTTNASLDEIAENCGYYSVNSLINNFKAAYGTTPGKYRQLKRAEYLI
nr:substrate-binding domain-containing protein [Oceanipulchritudo coccoides]